MLDGERPEKPLALIEPFGNCCEWRDNQGGRFTAYGIHPRKPYTGLAEPAFHKDRGTLAGRREGNGKPLVFVEVRDSGQLPTKVMQPRPRLWH